jgi:hypothetical protein
VWVGAGRGLGRHAGRLILHCWPVDCRLKTPCCSHHALTRPAGPPGSAAAAGSARKRLRVYLRSEHQHQQNAADAEEPPSWVLSISGRLLGKDKAADKAAAAAEAAGVGQWRWRWR